MRVYTCQAFSAAAEVGCKSLAHKDIIAFATTQATLETLPPPRKTLSLSLRLACALLIPRRAERPYNLDIPAKEKWRCKSSMRYIRKPCTSRIFPQRTKKNIVFTFCCVVSLPPPRHRCANATRRRGSLPLHTKRACCVYRGGNAQSGGITTCLSQRTVKLTPPPSTRAFFFVVLPPW